MKRLFLAGFIIILASCAALAFPQRIISGIPSATEMLFALGLGGRVVGVTNNCNFPPEAKAKEKVGGFFLNLEKIKSLNPDLIVLLEDAQQQEVEKLRKFDLPVYAINPHSVAEVMASLASLGDITGATSEARKLIGQMRGRINAVLPEVKSFESILKRPRVLVVVGYNPLIVAGGGNFIDDVVKSAGGQNIAAGSTAAYPQYSFERLLMENPEYIIIPEGVVKKEELIDNRRWNSLKAVQSGRILFIDADVLSRPGPRVVEAIEKIAGFIHEKKT